MTHHTILWLMFIITALVVTPWWMDVRSSAIWEKTRAKKRRWWQYFGYFTLFVLQDTTVMLLFSFIFTRALFAWATGVSFL